MTIQSEASAHDAVRQAGAGTPWHETHGSRLAHVALEEASMIRFATVTAYALATASVLLAASPASACGGCFAPTGTVTVVTAHRMALSISETETTLWDQIQYAGAPEDFVWVLPVRSGAVVELASNELFGYLESVT